MIHSFLENLEWRFATKEFDPNHQVPIADFEKILHAVQFAPSSKGLQPWQIVVVTEKAMKQKLFPFANNQPQVLNCSHLLVFCVRTDLKQRVEDYLHSAVVGKTAEEVERLRKNFQAFIERKKTQGVDAWAARQTYIALGFALAACAELKIDSCPMEGFQPAEFDHILHLPSQTNSVVLLAIGYRVAEPTRKKFRFSQKDLFIKK